MAVLSRDFSISTFLLLLNLKVGAKSAAWQEMHAVEASP